MAVKKDKQTSTNGSDVTPGPATPPEKLHLDLSEFSEKVIDINYGYPLAVVWASLSTLLHLEETSNFVESAGIAEK